MSQIGNALRMQNKVKEALEWNLRCYAIQRRTLGKDHPDSYRMQHNIGMVYVKLGDFTSAETHAKETFEAYQRMLGPDHATTLIVQTGLADIYRLQGKYEAAEELLLDCLKHKTTSLIVAESCNRLLGLMYLDHPQRQSGNAILPFCITKFHNPNGRTASPVEAVTTTIVRLCIAVKFMTEQGRTPVKVIAYIPALFALKMKTGEFGSLDEIDI
ncbi:hypothetical protein AC1031_020635 [Aphanomyces cochlioides]|nr:hypothetical protein AC1031_020635 [Aphanomyces cochlioides]